MPISFGHHGKLYLLVCQNFTLRVHRIVFVFIGSIFFAKNNSFQIIFRILDGDFSGFRQKFSSTVVRTALVSRFLIRFLPIFFGVHAKFFRLVCRNCTLRVHRIISMESIFFEKKNNFQFLFRILDGDYPGFRRKLSNTVVRIALDSKLLIGFMSIFFELCATSVSWSVRSALHVSTGLCL